MSDWRTTELWKQMWQKHIRSAKEYTEYPDGYCRAALIANMEYVCARALEIMEARYE